MSIEIRALAKLSEMRLAVELQQAYWGNSIESVVSGQTLYSIVNAGGHVIAAFDNDRMIGVLIGLIGADANPAHEHLKIFSKRMVVLPDYRGQGIAESLKLQQLELAKSQGIQSVTWTFDPLLSLNAHFNIRKLGCTCRTYVVDYYGRDGDSYGLSILGSSDRWKTDWNAESERVLTRQNGNFVGFTFEDYVKSYAYVAKAIIRGSAMSFLTDTLNESESDYILVEIPRDYRALTKKSPDLAISWRAQTRLIFTQLVNEEKYWVVDFVEQQLDDEQHMFYVLQRDNQEMKD